MLVMCSLYDFLIEFLTINFVNPSNNDLFSVCILLNFGFSIPISKALPPAQSGKLLNKLLESLDKKLFIIRLLSSMKLSEKMLAISSSLLNAGLKLSIVLSSSSVTVSIFIYSLSLSSKFMISSSLTDSGVFSFSTLVSSSSAFKYGLSS